MARTEAIATWTEMLRDTIAAAHGLEAAIAATSPVAPGPIHDEIGALAARLQHTSLDTGLRGLADDLAHPIADLVVAALSERRGRPYASWPTCSAPLRKRRGTKPRCSSASRPPAPACAPRCG